MTGSTSGLGKVIARRFAAEGAAVVVSGRNEERGVLVVDDLTARGGTATFVPADLGNEEACSRLVEEAVEKLGSLTILVNNAVATVSGRATVTEQDTPSWEEAFRVNVTAPMWLCRAAIPHMVETGHGSIVNVSSRAAERASPALAAYVASKGALNALTRSIATDYATQGVRANTLSPGYVLHEQRDADLTPERQERLEAMHLTRLPIADDVAAGAVYLAGRESETVTGMLLPVDGGSSTAARATSFG